MRNSKTKFKRRVSVLVRKHRPRRADTVPAWLLLIACAACIIVPHVMRAAPPSAPVHAPAPTEPAPVPTPAVQPPAPRPPSASSGRPSQAQKDATAAVCRKVAENRRDLYAPSGVSPELFASTCYYDLLAMAYAESRFDCAAVGDQGRSRGCFQIQTAMHGISVADAEDYAYAAEWTLDRMVRDTGYPRMRTASISRHNGSGDRADAYAESVKATSHSFEASGL